MSEKRKFLKNFQKRAVIGEAGDREKRIESRDKGKGNGKNLDATGAKFAKFREVGRATAIARALNAKVAKEERKGRGGVRFLCVKRSAGRGHRRVEVFEE